MKIIILISVFLYILSLNPIFYLNCKGGASRLKKPSTSKCREYDPDGGYCCYVQEKYYKNYEDDYIYDELKHNDDGDKVDEDDIIRIKPEKLRNLDDIDDYCLGISEEGFANLTLVAKEYKKKTHADVLTINCGIKSAKASGNKLTINKMIMILNILIYYLL